MVSPWPSSSKGRERLGEGGAVQCERLRQGSHAHLHDGLARSHAHIVEIRGSNCGTHTSAASCTYRAQTSKAAASPDRNRLHRPRTDKPTRRLLAAAVVVPLLLVGGAVAYAAILASDGTITACRRTSGGQVGALRVIDAEAGQQCGFGEAPLTWNQTGPQGRPGADGMLGRHVATRTETQSVTGKSRRPRRIASGTEDGVRLIKDQRRRVVGVDRLRERSCRDVRRGQRLMDGLASNLLQPRLAAPLQRPRTCV
jgi:hypothetical protein